MTRRLSRRTVMIHGTGRSGTTWLAGALASPFRYRLLFEPFHPGAVPEAACVADRYVSPGDMDRATVDFCHRALDDRIDSPWIRAYCSRRFGLHRRRWWPRLRICKDVRTNLLLPALREHFGLDTIVIVRHPAAVVESFLRRRYQWGWEVEDLLEQGAYFEAHGLPIEGLGAFLETRTRRLALRWVVENAYILRGACPWVRVVRYEELVARPVPVLRRLASELALVPPSEDVVRRPSATSDTSSPGYGAPDPEGWRSRLDGTQVRDVELVLEHFEVTYGD